jgi:chemotaxis protein MotD
MNPLDEALRAPAAVSGKAGSRQGRRDQSPGKLGAFENAVADAGRQKKQQGQGSAASARQDAGKPAANGSQADFTIGNRGTSPLIAGNASERSGRFSDVSTQARGQSDPESVGSQEQSSSNVVGARQKMMTRLQHGRPTEKATPGGNQASGEREEHALTAKAKGPWSRQASTEVNATRDSLGDEMPDGNTGSIEPAGETVSDLLTLLGSTMQTAASVPAEGKAPRASGDRAADVLSAKIAGGVPADVATDDDLQAGKRPDEAESDRLFRFARADGKGTAVSMNISKDGESVVVENGGSSAASRAETVTVLEARRYLGVAMNTNSAAVASAVAGDGEWAHALQSGQALTQPQPETWSQAGKALNTLKIQMHPIDLGMVTATLRLKDDELHVDLKVETGEAFRQLRDDQSEMVKALRAQGFAVDQVNIVFNAGSDASNGNGSQPQAQAQLGQPGRERAGTDGGEGRQRQDGGQVDAAEGWTGNDGTDDASIGAERPRAGHVYM